MCGRRSSSGWHGRGGGQWVDQRLRAVAPDPGTLLSFRFSADFLFSACFFFTFIFHLQPSRETELVALGPTSSPPFPVP